MKPISRRTLLRGTGAALTLPFLEAMGSADELTTPPLRSAFLFVPNGVVPENWTPKGKNDRYELSPMLQSLSKVKSKICVLENLWNEQTVGRNGHWPKVPAWLSGGYVIRSNGRNLDNGGTSVDQLMAQKVGSKTVLPSLELGIDKPRTGIDGVGGGFARIYGSFISWRDRNTPVARELVPQLAFDRLFRTASLPKLAGIDPNSPEMKQTLQHDEASVLDLVLESSKDLHRKVGFADRAKIDEYMESVRSVETRIQAGLADKPRWQNEGEIDIPRPPAGVPEDHQEHVRLMLDILVLAFWTDTTRVATFMMGDAQTGRDFSFLDGVNGGFHKLSHHREKREVRAQYERIATWHVEQMAYFLAKLQALEEGSGHLLNNCQILYGSSIKDGNKHSEHDLPLLLAGGGNGRILSGRRLIADQDTPLCNLYVSMLRNMGIETQSFGDSTGSLDDLLRG
ncbi:MAG: DUF1552 domain-containing protein [Planctomycetota bacterium]